jgi:hypothetical protein
MRLAYGAGPSQYAELLLPAGCGSGSRGGDPARWLLVVDLISVMLLH